MKLMSNKILCIDTTSEFCSVSLFEKNMLIDYENSLIERSHSKLLINQIDNILKNNNLHIKNIDAFAISKGPGSYTGLRIGLSSIKGFCLALEKPMIAINTLKILAKSALKFINNKSAILCPMIDARRMEVFTKIYDFKLKELAVDRALILEKDSFDKFKNDDVYFFGNGSDKYKDMVTRKNFIFIKNIFSDSRYMGKLAFNKYKLKDFENLSTFEPNYIKDFYLIKRKGKWMRS